MAGVMRSEVLRWLVTEKKVADKSRYPECLKNVTSRVIIASHIRSKQDAWPTTILLCS